MAHYTTIFVFLFLPFTIVAQIDHWETAVYDSDIWSYRLGTSEPPSNWSSLTFNDDSWQQGQGGIGYGDGDDGTTIAPVESVYLRREFTIFDKDKIKQAILHADFDDAFVAYINGQEFTRFGLDGNPPTFDTWALDLHEAQLYQGGLPESFVISEADIDQFFVDGTNVLAVQVHNFDGVASSDLSANFFLSFGITDTSNDYGDLPDWFEPPVPPLGDFSTPLPIIKINTYGVDIPEEPSIEGQMGIVWNGSGGLNNSSQQPNNFFGKIAIDKRGQSSLYFFPKHGYAIETKDENGEDMDVSFLNFPEEEDWILHGPYSDKTLMRNVLAMHLANGIGPFNSRTRFVELMVNGQYDGIYVLMEKIKRDKNRVDIANLNEEDISGDELTGGYIFKIDHGDAHWYSQYSPVFNPDINLGFQYVSPKQSQIMPPQETYIQSYVDSFEIALKATNFSYGGKRYSDYIDLASFADHFILKELSKDVDAFRLSSYYYKKKDSNGGKIYAGPAWDFNLAFGNADYCEGGLAQGWIYQVYCGDHPFWWNRLLVDDVFKNTLNCRWEELREGPLHLDSIFQFIDEKVALLNPTLNRNFQRWPVFNEYIWPNAVVFGSYEEEINYMKDFISDRIVWMDANMPGNCAVGLPTLSSTPISISPNPFEDNVNLSFELDKKTPVEIRIYNAIGQEFLYLNKGISQAGSYNEILSLSALPPGLYFCELHLGTKSTVLRIVK